MRFMMLVKSNEQSEAGILPSAERIAEMGRYNEQLIKAGILLAGDGLTPSAMGSRVYISGDTRTVVDGPFSETGELLGGFWMIQVKSKAEAIEWAKRAPNPAGTSDAYIEIRRVWEAEDFATG
jgi:hypothetical protein